MKTIVRISATALLSIIAGTAMAAGTDSKIVIQNNSHFAVHQLYFSPTDQREWGADQLGNHTINTGGTFTLNGVPCDAYDVKVVDEDGDECIVESVALCADKDKWVIDDADLLGCQAATQAE